MDRTATNRTLVVVTAFTASLLIGLLVDGVGDGRRKGVTATGRDWRPRFSWSTRAAPPSPKKICRASRAWSSLASLIVPNVCPTALVEMSEILRAMGKDADRVNAYFISVDPSATTWRR